MNSLNFKGTDFLLEANDLDPDLYHALEDCGASGEADESVAYIFDNFDVVGDVADCAAYLVGYDTWRPAQLASHVDNLNRLVWLTGCALYADECVYFTTN